MESMDISLINFANEVLKFNGCNCTEIFYLQKIEVVDGIVINVNFYCKSFISDETILHHQSR